MAAKPGSLRYEAERRGVSLYAIRTERGAARGLNPREAVGKGRPDRGEVAGPRQAAGLLARLLGAEPAAPIGRLPRTPGRAPEAPDGGGVPVIGGGGRRSAVTRFLDARGIQAPRDSGGPFSITIAGVGRVSGMGRARFLRFYQELRDDGIDFDTDYG